MPPTTPLGETLLPSAPPPDTATLQPAADTGRPASDEAANLALVQIPGYEIIEELGRGGMGVVYKARQIKANRLVALKMILSGAHASADDVKRFQVEAESVARLNHPNIVQVHDVGEHEGRPFFSLEYCGGGSLEKKLRENPLPPMEAAGIVELLARAMEAAHKERIIHRDLKPANVLLLDDRTPKITDFGLAKKLDDVGQTQSGAVMGTPSYMAPEQAAGKAGHAGPLADVYALGAILYDCLTGRPPFRAPTAVDTILQVIHDDPVPISRLTPKTPRDLETICLKCLQKEPGKRYPSALALAEDLRRYLDGKPISARPVGRLERGWRWCKRNPVVAALSALVVLLMTGGFALVTWLWLDAVNARNEADRRALEAEVAKKSANEQTLRAEAALERTETALYFNRIRQAEQAALARNTSLVQRILDECRLDLRNLEWRLLLHGSGTRLDKFDSTAQSLAFSPDSTRIAIGGMDHLVRIHDTSGKLLQTLPEQPGAVLAVAFHPDGKRLASASTDSLVRLWDTETGKELRQLKGHNDPVFALSFSPDGKQLVSGSKDFSALIWNLDSEEEPRALGGHSGEIADTAFSPNGETLATASLDGTVKLWQSSSGKLLRTLRGHNLGVRSVTFGPQGDRLFSASLDGTMMLWETATGKLLQTIRGGHGIATLNRDGTRIAAIGDGVVQIWDVASGQEVLSLPGQTGEAPDRLGFSPDGNRLAVCWINTGKPRKGEVSILDATPPPGRFAIRTHGFTLPVAALSEDGRLLATAGMAVGSRVVTIQVWDTKTALEVQRMEGHANVLTCLAFRPDGRQLATGSADRSVMLWDIETGKAPQTLAGHGKGVVNLAYSADGTRLAVAAADGSVRLHDLQAGQPRWTETGHDPGCPVLAFSPDGKLLAISGQKALLFRSVDSGEAAVGLPEKIVAATFHPESNRLAAAALDRSVRLWERPGGKQIHLLKSEDAPRRLRFDDGGRTLSLLDGGGRVQVWKTEDGELLRSENVVTVDARTSTPLVLGAQYVVTVAADRTIHVWNRPR
jgi:WD40 repeat protein/tRNA A-37 threonylcarbamoyl transferase component Bud32